MITRKLTKGWFEVPAETEVYVTGESNDGSPGMPRYRTLVVTRTDGQPMVGPDGPKREVGVAESFLDAPVPRMARELSLMEMLDLD